MLRLAKDSQWAERHVSRHGHDTRPYGTARHEHVSVRHEAQHDTHVGRAGPRILGTRALKHDTIKDGPKYDTRKST